MFDGAGYVMCLLALPPMLMLCALGLLCALAGFGASTTVGGQSSSAGLVYGLVACVSMFACSTCIAVVGQARCGERGCDNILLGK